MDQITLIHYQLSTELVWEGKYDEYGNRREIDIAGCSMPMQKIETIDEPRSQAAAKGKQGLLAFEKETTRLDDFRNRLIWGDNKLVMASLLKNFKGKIDLIYIDPPFDVGADFGEHANSWAILSIMIIKIRFNIIIPNSGWPTYYLRG